MHLNQFKNGGLALQMNLTGPFEKHVNKSATRKKMSVLHYETNELNKFI